MKEFNHINLTPIIENTPNPRIGVVALSTDFTIEQDFRKICHMLPIDIFVNRIPFENPLNQENYLKMINHLEVVAGNILPGERIDVVAYGCTSGTVAIGDEKISSKIQKAKPNCCTTTPITASLKAFEKLNMKKIAVLTPYPKKVNQTIFDYLINNNIEVESFSSFNLNYDSEIAQIKPENIIDQISEINLDDVDGLFVSCTAMKIVDVLDIAEQKFQTTIVSSNQAIIWDCLRLIKVNTSIRGFGKLLLN